MEYPYKEVHVLMLSWEEDDLGVLEEVRTLEYVFREVYQFTSTAHVRIPSENPYALVERTLDELKRFWSAPEHLLIVYYGGHASLDGWGRITWAPYKSRTDKGIPTLEWYALQLGLERTASDVLLLLDCCESSGSLDTPITRQGGTTEMIAACGFGQTAPGAGRTSFTNALTKTLINLADSGETFSAAELHREIVSWCVHGGNARQYGRKLLHHKGYTVGMPTQAVAPHQLQAWNYPLQTTLAVGQGPSTTHQANNQPHLPTAPLQQFAGFQQTNMSMSSSQQDLMPHVKSTQQPDVMDHAYLAAPQQPVLQHQQLAQQFLMHNPQMLPSIQQLGLGQPIRQQTVEKFPARPAPAHFGMQHNMLQQPASNLQSLPQPAQTYTLNAQQLAANVPIVQPWKGDILAAEELGEASSLAQAVQLLRDQRGQPVMGLTAKNLLHHVLRAIPPRPPPVRNLTPNPVFVRLNGGLSAPSIQLKVLDHQQPQEAVPLLAANMRVSERDAPKLISWKNVDRWFGKLPRAVVDGISNRAVREYLESIAQVAEAELTKGNGSDGEGSKTSSRKRRRTNSNRS